MHVGPIRIRPFPLASAVLGLLGALHAQHSVTPYGTGSQGAGGFTPRTWVAGSPHLGNGGFALTVDRGRPGAAAIAAVALAPAQLPLLSFTLLLDPGSLSVLPSTLLGGPNGTPGLGVGSASLPVPTTALLAGIDVFAQWFVLDAAAPGGVAAADATRITVTRGPLVIGQGLGSIETFVPPAGAYSSQPTGLDPYGVARNRAGTLAFLLFAFGPPATGLEIHDLTTTPPTRLVTTGMAAGPRALAVHPADDRLYVVYRQTATSGAIGWHDIRPGSATLGARQGLVSGIASPGELTRIAYADVSADGRVLVVVGFDLFADLRTLWVVDVDPTSTRRDQVLRQFRYTSAQMLAFGGVAVTGNGRHALVPGMHANQGRLLRIDLQTGAIVGSVSFPGPADGIALDPRERFAAMASTTGNTSEVAVVSLEPGPAFFTARTFTTGAAWIYPLALTADGATVVAPDVANGGFAAFDVATGAAQWSFPFPTSTVACIVR